MGTCFSGRLMIVTPIISIEITISLNRLAACEGQAYGTVQQVGVSGGLGNHQLVVAVGSLRPGTTLLSGGRSKDVARPHRRTRVSFADPQRC